MPLDSRELSQRLQNLRRSLDRFPKDSSPDEVHLLRSSTRRVESILQALDMNSSENEEKLLARLKSVRARAGKVRDMDVLTAYVVAFGLKDDPNCVIRLLQNLSMERYRQACKLHTIVRHNASELAQRLNQSRRKLSSAVNRFAKAKFDLDRKSDHQADERPLHAMSVALRLSKELVSVPKLGPSNLHAYRIEVKRLRYVLEMADSDRGGRKPLLDELKLVQKTIGEWHDWMELSRIAGELLQRDKGCKIVRKIKQTAHQKLDEALTVTEQMRHRYLQPSRGKENQQVRDTKRSQLAGAVLLAASEIAG